MGTKEGSIIATIITIHMPRNDAATPDHVCPGIRIHTIDIVQPPGIATSPIANIDVHQTTVTAALATKSMPERPRKRRSEPRSRNIGCELDQTLLYESWCRHQTPVSLRPFGARSSHWYIPQRLSTPREYAE